MKKIILGIALATFAVSTAQACDGMKGHEKTDKGDQTSQSSAKKQDKTNATSGAQKS